MKFTNYSFILGIALLAAASCTKAGTEAADGDSRVAVRFVAGIQTRAHDDAWDANDAVGITMVQNGAVFGNIFNYQYSTPDGGAEFHPTAGNTIYFPDNGSDVSFRAYYPYTDAMGTEMTYPLDVADQSDLTAIDFLTADFSEGTYNKQNSVVNIKFYHRLTKLDFELSKDGTVTTDLRRFTLTIRGMKTTGTYDVMNETAQHDEASTADIVVPPDASYDSQRSAIVLPRTTAGPGVEFVFTNGSEEYTAQMPADLVLNPKTRYLFKIHISKTQMSITAEVVDWVDGPETELVWVMPGTQVSGGTNVKTGDRLSVYTGNATARRELTTFTYSGTGQGDGLWTPDNARQWEDVALPTTFYASITGQAAPSGSNQLADYMVARPIEVSSAKGLSFELTHAAAMVSVQVKANSSYSLDDFEISLPQYAVGGALNNGIFEPGTGSDDISVPIDNGVAKALIQPQMRTSGSTVVRLKYNPSSGAHNTFDLKSDADLDFEAGKAYVLVVDITKTPMSISAKVIDWADGGTVPLRAPGITIGGSINNTSDIFENKSIKVYMTADSFRELTYTYRQAPGAAYWTWGTSTPVYWDEFPQNTGIAMTAAYYPLQDLTPTGVDGSTPIAWRVPQDQSTGYAPYDVLTSYLELNSAEPKYANFIFSHALAKLRVEITAPGFTAQQLAGMQVTLKDFLLDGGLGLQGNGTLAGSTYGDVTPLEEQPGAVYSALVFPKSRPAGSTVVSVTLPGYTNPFTGKLSTELPLAAGKQTILKITLTLTEMELSATLEPWGNAGSGEVEIQ